MNRSTTSASVASSAWRSLIATRRLINACSARNTEPIPPSPSGRRIRYLPSTTSPTFTTASPPVEFDITGNHEAVVQQSKAETFLILVSFFVDDVRGQLASAYARLCDEQGREEAVDIAIRSVGEAP